jgi:hypothetical protein
MATRRVPAPRSGGEGIPVGEFEQRQLKAIRDELNRAHADRVAPVSPPRAVRRRPEAEEMSRVGAERDRATASESTISSGTNISECQASRAFLGRTGSSSPASTAHRKAILEAWHEHCG